MEQKPKISLNILNFLCIFFPPGPRSGYALSMWIGIQESANNADPCGFISTGISKLIHGQSFFMISNILQNHVCQRFQSFCALTFSMSFRRIVAFKAGASVLPERTLWLYSGSNEAAFIQTY